MKKMLEKFKKSKSSLALVILALVLIIAGISFALFNPSINLLGRRNIKISKCELDINFKESDELMLVSKYPISTRQALEGGYKPKKVTITNNSTCDMAYYKLTIKDLINSSINKDVIQYHVVDKQNTMTYKLGDVNNDTSITASDSTLVLRYLRDRAIKTTSSILKYAGDVDGDGKITENDNTIFAKYISKQITTFPAGAPLEEKTTTKEIIDVNPDTFLIENSLEKGKTHEYEIIMWISNAATNNDIYVNGDSSKPKEYKFALNIESSDEEIKGPDYALEFAQAKVGADGLEQITHTIDNTLQVDSKFATEYRYRGGDSVVKNYVTFNNETWRIIGVIPTEDTNGNVENRIKIIRDTSIGNMKWNTIEDTTTNSKNNWATGTLNTYLNNDYYNTLTTDSKNMIGTAKYYLGGYDYSNMTTDVMWQYERKNEANRTDYYYGTNPVMQSDTSKKIALMYASDYGYAASKNCTSNLRSYYSSTSCITANNWLDKTQYEWLLTHVSGDSYSAFDVNSDGYVDDDGGVDVSFSELAVRPVLYLSSNVKISSGEGTSQKPYMLSIS